MSDKKTKAELFEMLAEAVRNTQPQPIGATQPEPIRDAQPELKRKKATKGTPKTKKSRASAGRKQRRR
jgi:hypothetical protein